MRRFRVKRESTRGTRRLHCTAWRPNRRYYVAEPLVAPPTAPIGLLMHIVWVHIMCAWCRCKEWVQRSRRQDLLNKEIAKLYRNYHLCSDHFEESQFMNAQEKKRLIWNAVPSIFNVPNPPPSVTLKWRLPDRKPLDRVSSSAKKRRLTGKW